MSLWQFPMHPNCHQNDNICDSAKFWDGIYGVTKWQWVHTLRTHTERAIIKFRLGDANMRRLADMSEPIKVVWHWVIIGLDLVQYGITVRNASNSHLLKTCLPINHCSSVNYDGFEILYKARQYHCRALCKITNRLRNWVMNYGQIAKIYPTKHKKVLLLYATMILVPSFNA